MSAGAQALSAYYVDEESETLGIKKDWGLVSGCVDVYARQNSLTDIKGIWSNHIEACKHPLIAISENTAWRISPHGENKVGNGEIWLSRQH
jgi:hypothetical protein